MKENNKELILSVTADDCEWQYFRGSGKGGQKRNKTSNAVRCIHRPSGAVGVAQDTRSQAENKKLAFRRMAESKVFKDWLKLEVSRITGEERKIKEKIDREINDPFITIIEVRKGGKWVREEEGGIDDQAE